MSYKKYILEKYIKSQETEETEETEETKELEEIELQEIERLKKMMNDIISEKNTLEIQNSLLRYQTIKLTKEKIELQDRLHKKINSTMMNWEMLEELKFENLLYNKMNNASNTSKKRKSLLNVEKIINELNKDSQQQKKQKTQSKKTTIITPPTKKEISVIYDSDETETDDELLSFTKT
jgi:hypothetical protein